MSFLVAAALGVGLFVAIPVAAHLLRRGKARERLFPPTALVPSARSVARQRATLEDRLLLLIRGLLIVCLAVIGATPFVRCSRLSLDRSAGASVAMALVIDDSHSMRARDAEGVRFERAARAAEQLLASAREGDAIALVLAGKPARLALAATTDLGAARRALAEALEGDRSTDLQGAVNLARTSLASLPQRDKRIVLLSDLAGGPLPGGQPAFWAALPDLAQALENCAICSAERRGRRVTARIACTSPAAAAGRTVSIVGDKSGKPVPLLARAGVQDLGLDFDLKLDHPELQLSGGDALSADDRAPLAAESAALGVLVAADVSGASAETGGPPVLEQAVASLERNAQVHPITVLPDDANEFRNNGLLLLDDPGGITPEARGALTSFVEHGGVAVAFLGPRVEQTPLGATLEPFVHGAVHWESQAAPYEVNQASMAWLGPEATSLADLKLRGRAGLSTTDLLGARVLATFADGQALLTQRELARGALFTLALPTGVEHGNFPLRPAFLALLDRFLDEAQRRRGAAQSVAGSEWLFPAASRVVVDGPRGPLSVHEQSAPDGSQQAVTPVIAGRYTVHVDDSTEERIVTLEPVEISTLPEKPPSSSERTRGDARAGSVDASPELGFVALALLALELGLRVVRRVTSERSLTSVAAPRSRAS